MIQNIIPELKLPADETEASATFSLDRRYRYCLLRKWDKDKPLAMLIGLNPSTANEATNDHTIKRVIKVCRELGYGGFYMMNLFALVTSKPEVLFASADPLGKNDDWLLNISKKCQDVIFCWGNFKVGDRAKFVQALFPKALCFRKNKNGSPQHPLLLPKEISLIDFYK